jgi:uncharacterized membrane protein
MTPTRKYLDYKEPSRETSVLAGILAFLIIAAAIGLLIYLNIEVWTAIFG